MGIAIVIIVLIVIAVAAYYSYVQEQKRREELAAMAAELGWDFDPRKDYSHDDQFDQFAIFRKGHSRFAHNTLRGAVDVDGRRWKVQMGDYHYKVTSGSGKNRRTTTYRLSYLIMHMPFFGVPDLFIRPEGFFDKVAGFIGFDDIDFESAEFSDRFHVKSSDKRFAYDVIHPRMMEFLLDGQSPTIDIEQCACCICTGTKRWTPQQFNSILRWGQEFFARWPRHLKDDLESRSRV